MQGAQVQICDAWSENKITHATQSMAKGFFKKEKKLIVNLGDVNRYHCKILSILLYVWIFYNKTLVRGGKKISQAF